MEKQEYTERYDVSDEYLNAVNEMTAFVSDIKNRLLIQMFHTINNIYNIDQVTFVNKFDTISSVDTLGSMYENKHTFILRTTVFYEINALKN